MPTLTSDINGLLDVKMNTSFDLHAVNVFGRTHLDENPKVGFHCIAQFGLPFILWSPRFNVTADVHIRVNSGAPHYHDLWGLGDDIPGMIAHEVQHSLYYYAVLTLTAEHSLRPSERQSFCALSFCESAALQAISKFKSDFGEAYPLYLRGQLGLHGHWGRGPKPRSVEDYIRDFKFTIGW